MENEDKHSLEGVEDCEKVGHDHRGLVDEEQAEGPRQDQEEKKRKAAKDPRSREKKKRKKNPKETKKNKKTKKKQQRSGI